MYRDTHDDLTRIQESSQIMKRYPHRIPVIIEPRRDTITVMDKKKFMVPKELIFAQLFYVVRKRIRMKPEQALFFFTNNRLITASSSVVDVYEKEKEERILGRDQEFLL